MAMEVNSNVKGNAIYVDTKHFTLEELHLVEKFYCEILSKIFQLKTINMITIEPQKYSFAQGIKENYLLYNNGSNLLISEIENSDLDFLESISQSEEFKRGLLLLLKCDKNLIKEKINDILKITSQDDVEISLKATVIFCQNDGNTLVIYNSDLTIDYINVLKEQVYQRNK
jgi:hypothetical protein